MKRVPVGLAMLVLSSSCAGQVVSVEEEAEDTRGQAATTDEAGDDGKVLEDPPAARPADENENPGGMASAMGYSPYTLRECPVMGDLSQIATNEGPFSLCRTDADCDSDFAHYCYASEGQLGFCQVPDADIWCDGEGDVNLQSIPPIPDLGPGICVYDDWYDFLCCTFPHAWACQEVSFPDLGCDVVESEPSDGDGCAATYECGDRGLLRVRCDGENDGTYTSLCSCVKDEESVAAVSEALFPGEEESACVAAAVTCLND